MRSILQTMSGFRSWSRSIAKWLAHPLRNNLSNSYKQTRPGSPPRPYQRSTFTPLTCHRNRNIKKTRSCSSSTRIGCNMSSVGRPWILRQSQSAQRTRILTKSKMKEPASIAESRWTASAIGRRSRRQIGRKSSWSPQASPSSASSVRPHPHSRRL